MTNGAGPKAPRSESARRTRTSIFNREVLREGQGLVTQNPR